MTKTTSEEDADVSLDRLRHWMAAHDVKQILVKELAPNDNSKNQLYLGGSLEIANILPISGDVRVEVTEKGNKSLKASLSFWWLQRDGRAVQAHHTQIILYPQYPEVRLSGFLRGVPNAPSEMMSARSPGRILFLGITWDNRIIAWAAVADSKVAKAFGELGQLETHGVFAVLPVEVNEMRTSKARLLSELRRIHLLGWIASKSLKSDGSLVDCNAPQCVGYTLEAELGIARNGISQPDFLGWEVKALTVSSFSKQPTAKAISLMTPEPTGGYYKEQGVEAFVRKYGYSDKKGRADRMNFGGVFRSGQLHSDTGLTLMLSGYDVVAGIITNPGGSLGLIDDKGNVAAEWSIAHLMGIWNRKHAQAVYVPAMKRLKPERQYAYGPKVRLGEGTDIIRLLKAIATGKVYFDPSHKIEGLSSGNPATKRRSMFRIKSSDILCLYADMQEY